jgi:cellulose synthase/poly-beta-1,6-N-acetylglucosamine synthase-like glycosyltransferase
MKKFLLAAIVGGALLVALSYVLNTLFLNSFAIHSTLMNMGVAFIVFFTAILAVRFLLLVFFSLLKVISKSLGQSHPFRYSKKISVIIPAYNEEKVIRTSITSVLRQSYPYIELIVVDDGSKDRTYSIAKGFERHYKGTKSIKVIHQHNQGKANAINTGIRHCSGELVMVVDADSRLDKEAVSLMAQYFLDPTISAVAGSVLISNQKNLLTKLQALEYIQGLNMVRNAQAFLRMVNIIPGPIGMFRKKDLYEVGLYDDDTFAEDCDVTLKLLAKGKNIDFEPEAKAYTEAPDHLLDLIKQRYRWTRGILQALRKHKAFLFSKKKPFLTFTLWYMLFETAIWPAVDITINLFIIYLSVIFGVSIFILFWWLLFTLLDMIGTLYCLLMTNERLGLVFYSVFYRIFFIPIINIIRFLATIEEWLKIKMEWGKLERKGEI